MNTKTLSIIIGAVVVVGAAFFLMKGSDGPLGGEPMSQKSSLKGLLAINSPQSCTFRDKTDVAETSGTVHVMRGRMRGDFEAITSGGLEKSHMIVDGEKAYVWSDSAPQGMMMMFTDFDQPNNQQSTDVNKEVDYTCSYPYA
jgi:hypothetical protein